MNWVSGHIGPVYWTLFVLTFFLLAAWESRRPLAKIQHTERRWGNHGILFALTIVFLSVVLRSSPILVAAAVQDSPYGLLNHLPLIVAFPLALVLLDGVHYAYHWVFHHVAFLWPIHAVHHSDENYDLSTGVRFHPLEVLIARGSFLAAVFVLAPPVWAVIISELVTEVVNLAVHSNISLPRSMEQALRGALITPGIHRLHHSSQIRLQSGNFGQTTAIWDRLFGTYQEGSLDAGAFPTGLDELRGQDTLSLKYLLSAPFSRFLK